MTDFSVLRSRLTGTLTTPDDTVGVDAPRTTALSGRRGRSTRLVRQIGFAQPPSRGTPTSKPKSLTTLQGEPS